MMRRKPPTWLLPIFLLGCACVPAQADHRPVLVVEPATGIPLEVREGDWGLYRPGAPPRHLFRLAPGALLPPAPGYFPSAGKLPQVGRLERESPASRRRPRRDTSFHRSWSAASAPADFDAPLARPPVVVVAPPSGRGWVEPGERFGRDPEEP